MIGPRRAAVVTLLVGVLIGVAVAIAVPRTSAVDQRGADALLPLPGSPKIGPPHRPLPYQGALRVHTGTMRTELTAKDPSGGPEWRVRAFVADRLVPKEVRRPGTSGIAGTSLCAQLGRVVDGRFGWIDSSNTFRPIGVQYGGGPMLCGSRIPDRRRMPDVEVRTLITDPLRPDPQVRGLVAWGVVGARVSAVAVHLGGRVETPARSRRGAFLVFAGPALRHNEVKVTVTYPRARSKTVRSDEHMRLPGPQRDYPRPVAGTRQLEARAPDPGGGPPWGVLTAKGDHGGWCFGHAEQIVGDRVGQIDWNIGSLYEDDGMGLTISCESPRFPMTRKRPFNYGRQGGGGIGERQPDPGRALLRTLRGRSSIYGVTRPDVKLLTIATPRDVRTVVPTSRAHAFVVVYDGDFPSGNITITATFSDGTTASHTEHAGL